MPYIKEGRNLRLLASKCALYDCLLNVSFLPSGYVIKDMEMRSLMMDFDDNWVVNTMRLAQVPLLRLLQTYDKLYKAKVWSFHTHSYFLGFLSFSAMKRTTVNSLTVHSSPQLGPTHYVFKTLVWAKSMLSLLFCVEWESELTQRVVRHFLVIMYILY